MQNTKGPIRELLMTTYNGLVFTPSDEITISKFPVKNPQANEVLTRLLFVGLCGTDIQILRRMRKDPATILGHEGIGEILKVGNNIQKFKIGQRVVFNPVNSNNQRDILGHTIPGVFQEQYSIHQQQLDYGLIVPISNKLPAICGTLVEPLGTVIYGQSLVKKIQNPKSIAIVGAGPIGLLHTILAKLESQARVFLIHNNKRRILWALKKCIVSEKEALLDNSTIVDTMLSATNGKGVDAAYLCTNKPGALEGLNKALQYVKDEGVINMVGGIQDGDQVEEIPGIELNQIRRANICGNPAQGKIFEFKTKSGKKIFLTGHRGTSAHHLLLASQLLIDYPKLFLQIITHVVSLKSATKLFEQLIASRSHQLFGSEFVKAVIDMNSPSPAVENFVAERYL